MFCASRSLSRLSLAAYPPTVLRALIWCCVLFLSQNVSAGEEPVADLMRQAAEASRSGDRERAVGLLSSVIHRQVDHAEAFYFRGCEHFRLGKIDESVSDFDRFVVLRPAAEVKLWERGISYYYAEKYEQGAKQFEQYQTHYDNDVENAVWRYLCIAKQAGIAQARQTLLPIENDRRIPLMEIYDLFRGKRTVEDVVRAARADDPDPVQLKRRQFYADLYIGLFYEAESDERLAKRHIDKAAAAYEDGGYMWDVARVHSERLQDDDQSEAGKTE